MDQLYSLYRYELEKNISSLEKVDDDKRLLQTIRDMDHPLVLFFKTYRDDPNKRKEILYGKDAEYTRELNEENDFNWEIFEHVVLLPLLRYQRIIPIFNTKTNELDSIQITKKEKSATFHKKLQKSFRIVSGVILSLSLDLDENLRRKFDSGEVKFNRDNAIALMCGSKCYDEYLYPGYNTIIQRIKICYERAPNKECIDWTKWIQHDGMPGKIQICSVLDKSSTITSLQNLLGKKDITMEIIREENNDCRILGGITIIKDVHDNDAKDILEQVEKLRFIKYPNTRNGKRNHIRVASTTENLPLQYSSGSNVFFVLSVKMEPIEEKLLQKANEIAFQLYKRSKTRLIQKYGPKHACKLIGNFIPYSSCLWSCQRARDAGYGIHQDSTYLSSEVGLHYQEIVVTMIFHFDCDSRNGAYLFVYLDQDGKTKFKYMTFPNSVHVQDFGNQKNLWHQAGSVGGNTNGYRLVMTARRTGVKNPTKVMNEMISLKCPALDPLAKKIQQTIFEPTLRQIMDDKDGNLQFGICCDLNKRPTKIARKGKQKNVNHRVEKTADEDMDDAIMNPPTLPELDDNVSHMDSSAGIYDTNHYYEIDKSMEVAASNQSSYIQYGRGHQFLLHQSSMKILFRKRICIRTLDKSSGTYVRWAPMIRNRKIVEIGDFIPMHWYKDYHDIRINNQGGHIVSGDKETATGICLLHPERTDDYNTIINSVVNLKSKVSGIHFFGSGGAAKVMGSHPTLISMRLCGAGGMFASNQISTGTNQCLVDLCTSERPLHIALKLKERDDNGNEQVVYLGMFYIKGFDYGYHSPREPFRKGYNCDNVIGASFMDAKTHLFKAVKFDYDDGNDDGNDDGDERKWREYTIERDSPMSFGVVVSNKASDVLRADKQNYKRETVFESMERLSDTDLEKILHPLVDLPIDQVEPNEKEDEMVEEAEEKEEKEKNDEEDLMHSLDDLTINGNNGDEDFMPTY
ncbi:predicted protein [Chaetoceros tenuissimus]|uniref:Uncharacterized protein n=1 Tax=Chaetoceros tenuissimus TaxID=426638 RepID=A0AAD3D0K5_9STRA|nr:predicted protein [Chaetoceros tenuissimus]